MYEKRLTVRLEKYWDLIRKDAPLPPYAQFNRSSVQDAWDNCMIFAAQPSASKPIFRVSEAGEQIVELLGHDVIGRDASKASMRNFGGGKIADTVLATAESRAPELLEGKYVNPNNKIVKYRACLLPFGAEDEAISHILAGISWREFG